jgi:hypothetical protein
VLRRPVDFALNSTVAVMDQAGEVLPGPLAGPQPHVEGIERQVGAQAGRHLPAHDHPTEHVEDERDVGPPRVRADVGQVRHPQLVRAGRCELPLHQVLRPLGLSTIADGGAAGLLARDSTQALGAHEPLDGAPRHRDAFAVQLGVNLPGAVDTKVGLVGGLDVLDQLGVADRACRGWPGLGGVVAARGDLHAGFLQRGTDRLDPDLAPIDHVVAMGVDVGDYLVVGRSSSAAKKAEAVLKMWLVRRSSRFSRSSSASRSASLVVVPGRRPPSISACRTQPRKVSRCIPSCSATRAIAPCLVAGSARSSTARRTALSRSSSGYFLGAAMTLILHGLRASIRPGAIHLFDWSGRRQALADADRAATADAVAARTELAQQLALTQAGLDAEWAALLACDHDTVLGVLADAFADNEAAASAVGVENGEVSLLVVVPSESDVPERKPGVTPAGNLSLKKLTKRETADFYKLIVFGHLLVTLRETFAVAPSVESARIVAVRMTGRDAYGKSRPEVMAAMRCSRAALADVQWDRADAVQVANDCCTEKLVIQKGATRALQPVPLEDEPELRAMLAAVDLDDD